MRCVYGPLPCYERNLNQPQAATRSSEFEVRLDHSDIVLGTKRMCCSPASVRLGDVVEDATTPRMHDITPGSRMTLDLSQISPGRALSRSRACRAAFCRARAR